MVRGKRAELNPIDDAGIELDFFKEELENNIIDKLNQIGNVNILTAEELKTILGKETQ